MIRFLSRHGLLFFFLLIIWILGAAGRAPALPADFDVDAFLAQPFSVPLERVEKWSRTSRIHDDNQALATDLAATFAQTRDPRYARAALNILLAYADKYTALAAANHNDRNGGALHAQLLDEAKWLVLMAEAYELLRAGGAVTPDEHAALMSGLFEPAVAVEMGGSMPNNHQWWFNAAIGVCGYVLDRADWVDSALNGPRGFKAHLAEHINDDGLIFEQAITYQHFALVAYMHLASAAERHGHNLWNMRVDDTTVWDGLNGQKSLKLMFDAVAHFPFADGTMPAIRDSGPQGVSFVQSFYTDFTDYYEKYFSDDKPHLDALRAFADMQRLRNRGQAIPQAVAPPDGAFALNGLTTNGNSLFPSSGYAILRANALDLDAPQVAFTFGPYGGGHGHPDKLSFVLYANQEIVLPDVGRYEYGDPRHQSWAKQTLAHNAVVVDRKSYKPMHVPGMNEWAEAPAGDTGILREFTALPGFQLARATCDTAVDGVTLDRTMALFGGALIDVYRATSSREHTFDYVLHVNGAYQGGSLGLAAYEKSLGSDFGYQHLSHVQAGPRDAAAPWQSTWRTAGGRGLRVAALGAGRMAAVADAPGNPPDTTMPLMLLRDKGRDVRFVSVIVPFADPADDKTVRVSQDLDLKYLEDTDEPAPVGLLISGAAGASVFALAPGGVLYDLNTWMQTDARVAALSPPGAAGGPEEHLFLGVGRISHGSPGGLSAAHALDRLQVRYDTTEGIRLTIYTEHKNLLTIGDDMLFSITAACAHPGLRVNGAGRDVPESLSLELEPGQTTVEFFCK